MPRSVLVVDCQPETREVLCALVQRAGATAIAADRPEAALQLIVRQRPDLILLDGDSNLSGNPLVERDLRKLAGRMAIPIVVLGTQRSDKSGEANQAGVEFVAKPYHYGPLVRRIESLLAVRAETRRAA